jgi:hypothetical protein
LLSGKVPSKD